MKKEKLEDIVENLFIIPYLFKKKLIKHDLYKEEIDLSPAHFHILLTLTDKGDMAASELGKTLNICKSNVTPLVQKLIDKGLVQRITNENDRRYIYISITESGEKFLARHKELVIEHLQKKICSLKEEELEVLAESLQKLKVVLTKFE